MFLSFKRSVSVSIIIDGIELKGGLGVFRPEVDLNESQTGIGMAIKGGGMKADPGWGIGAIQWIVRLQYTSPLAFTLSLD